MITDAIKGDMVYISYFINKMQYLKWVPVLEVLDDSYIVELNGREAEVTFANVVQRKLRESEIPKKEAPVMKSEEERMNESVKGIRYIRKRNKHERKKDDA